MRLVHVCAVALSTIATTPTFAEVSEKLENAYFMVMHNYGRLMVYAEACDLDTRFGLKGAVLSSLPPVVDPVNTELDLDLAFEQEKSRSGSLDCDPEQTGKYSEYFQRSLNDLVAAVNSEAP